MLADFELLPTGVFITADDLPGIRAGPLAQFGA